MTHYRRDHHCVYLCDYHIILSTKYRRKIINTGVWKYLEGKLLEITEHYPKLYFKEMNHDQDHIHILISIPPQQSVGSIVRIIKTNTARGIKKQFSFINDIYWSIDGIWSEGYFVSTVGINEKIIKRYIQNQGDEDVGQTAMLFD